MLVSRRRIVALAPAGTLVGTLVGAVPADAAADTTDLALTCDLAAAPAIVRAAKAFRTRTGFRVRVLPTTLSLILPQLERQIQNDIVVTQPALLDRLEKAALVSPGGRTPAWRNRLVVAAAEPSLSQRGGAGDAFAIPDPTPAADFDGAEVLRRIGAAPASLLGVIDTLAVAWMLREGQARRGILHQTEVTADDRLRVAGTVPDDAWPPILYAATVTRLAYRPNPAAFVDFLTTPAGQAALRSAGLEPST